MNDLYEKITNQILESVDEAGDWKPSWRTKSAGLPHNYYTKKPYRGINIMMCWATAHLNGFSTAQWGTFKQWGMLNGRIKRGSKGTTIIYYNMTERMVDGKKIEIPVMKASTVFNLDQVDGIELPVQPEPISEEQRIYNCEARIKHFQCSGMEIVFDGDRAFYKPSTDVVNVPPFITFFAPEHYYATAFHEAVHWTGHKTRNNRFARDLIADLKGQDLRDEYAKEELVAELGAAFLCAELGIDNVVRDDHAAYLKVWYQRLKSDKKLIIQAASAASKAVDFLNQPLENVQIEVAA